MPETKNAVLNVTVCAGPSCSLMGGEALSAWRRQLAEAGLPIEGDDCGCTGNCLESPVVVWNGRFLTECTPESLTARLIDEGLM